ncbi:MAG TPA: NAD(P)H-binding protein [Jatrophihabitans sp.]|jgi:uncharacterized protein YbjT (DUF2867 family)|uniref:SDR family oxidoreductase n=1 Tax=Jatrophihabitans sp. TaxID=1932789 RepID=UPI002EDF34E5
MKTIAIAGGTGWVGRRVVESVRRLGAEPIVIARSKGIDLTTGTGLDQALEGVDDVIDVTNIVTQNRRRATAFFETSTRHLLDAEKRHGVKHHVLLSIVGIDRVGLGYYQAKLAQEDLVRQGPVPWTILRATQFHEFAAQMLGGGPVAVVPSMLSQPVAAQDVANELVRLATAPPVGMAAELAGPREERVPDMARRLASARGHQPLVITLPLPGATGRVMRTGALLPTNTGPRGTQTFDQWLQEST